MPLIKCPECGTEYYNDRASCPYCGCPRPARTAGQNGYRQPQRPAYTPQQPKKSSGNSGYIIFICILLVVISGGVAYFFFKQQHETQLELQRQREQIEKMHRDSVAEARREQEQSVKAYQEQELKRQQTISEIEKMVKDWVNTNVWRHASADMRHYYSACYRNYDFDNLEDRPLYDGDPFYLIQDEIQPGDYVLSSYCAQLNDNQAMVNVKFNLYDGPVNRILYLEKVGQEWQLTDFRNPDVDGTFLTTAKADVASLEAESYEVYYTE